ncbi:hypothetical protein AVEN_50258-1 [Araneus ventricosus]|uniref:Uncharacterized protein n=1 Tax=Araneus ventricosus TaxID=182803 RepID=A0A4Y1ZS62_ARAVE|nr:hypothetical protein AVEN_50258-1 [Araneus ventricosus]
MIYASHTLFIYLQSAKAQNYPRGCKAFHRPGETLHGTLILQSSPSQECPMAANVPLSMNAESLRDCGQVPASVHGCVDGKNFEQLL